MGRFSQNIQKYKFFWRKIVDLGDKRDIFKIRTNFSDRSEQYDEGTEQL